MTSKEILLEAVQHIGQMRQIASYWASDLSYMIRAVSIDPKVFMVNSNNDIVEFYWGLQKAQEKDPILKAALEHIAKQQLPKTNAFHEAASGFMSAIIRMELDLDEDDPIHEKERKWLVNLGNGYYLFTDFDEDDVSFRVETDPYSIVTIFIGIVLFPMIDSDWKRINEILGQLSNVSAR